MDQAGSSSARSPSPRDSHDTSSTVIPDILPLPARSLTVDRYPDIPMATPHEPSTLPSRPMLDLNLITPVTPPVAETAEALPEPHRSPRARLRAFFGLGNGPEVRERKDLVSLVWNLTFNGVQIVVAVVLLVFSSVHKSTSDQQMSEWAACSRPLGIWDAIWAIKLCFDCVVAFWTFRRDRVLHLSPLSSSDIEAAFNPIVDLNNHQPSSALNNPNPNTRPRSQASTPRLPRILPYSNLYARLSIILSFFSFVWFVAINVLIYSSVFTCRLTSPHLWWLTFGLVAITYLMILELLLLGLVVFVIGPIVYLVWNIFLICIGHHPLQNPHYIKPEVGKLSKSVVDRIPLVLYIPSPPEDDPSHKGSIAKPDPVHTYPPKPPTPSPPRRRFAFLRIKSSRKGNKKDKNNSHSNEKAPGSGENWEDNWEHGEYPFVRLEGNRAVCAICLMDFEEPKRIKAENGELGKGIEEIASPEKVQEVDQTQAVTGEDRLKLEDAGEGPQPLRLLACGHVFHQICLDPWLIGVSGRCPICQRPVEFSPPQKVSRTHQAR